MEQTWQQVAEEEIKPIDWTEPAVKPYKRDIWINPKVLQDLNCLVNPSANYLPPKQINATTKNWKANYCKRISSNWC